MAIDLIRMRLPFNVLDADVVTAICAAGQWDGVTPSTAEEFALQWLREQVQDTLETYNLEVLTAAAAASAASDLADAQDLIDAGIYRSA